jgi:hypothetical protein
MRKSRVLKIKLIFVEFFGKIKLKVIINYNNTNINSLCVCVSSFVYSGVCVCVSWKLRERVPLLFLFFFPFVSYIFLIFYAWNALLISSGRSTHSPFLYKQHHLIITQKSIKFVVCCVAISPIFVRTAGSAGITI